jgi:hypothetical protein
MSTKVVDAIAEEQLAAVTETAPEEVITPEETAAPSEIEISAPEETAAPEEVIVPEETASPEETPAAEPETEPEQEIETTVAETPVQQQEENHHLEKLEILGKLADLVVQDISEKIKSEVESLKQAFYRLKNTETDDARNAFVAAGGAEEEFQPQHDETEDRLKELLTIFREKKATLTAQNEKLLEENLQLKKSILEKLKELIDSNEDFYKIDTEYRKLQQQWKEIKQIPQSAVNELWKEYQVCSEKFYDLRKINIEMRDYDFKKNLEMKQALCEVVEKLAEEKDAVSAFFDLQKLHQEWREIGPVAKELREEIWNRFKKASGLINRKYQGHFEALRDMEKRNLEEKTACCEQVEKIDFSKLKSFKDWDNKVKEVLEIQEKWKTIGFAPKKHNVKIFDRFRTACDKFFHTKTTFYKTFKSDLEANLAKKKALCAQVEALKDSTDWKETAAKIAEIQQEWKTIGQAPRKHADAIWKRFITACDYFFEQKKLNTSLHNSEEVANLKKKKEIIAKINAIDTALPAKEAIENIRSLMSEWSKIGHVPYRDKDNILKKYRTAIDNHFDRLKVDESERRLKSFKSALNEFNPSGGKGKNKLYFERDKLMRTYDRLKNDIQTYENNIGFLTAASKGGSGLIKDLNKKIDSLKEELNLIVKKIGVIDENLEA